MSSVRRPEDLEVFRVAHAATRCVYRLTADFPASERYGLSSQLRRCTASICANLVEGAARLTKADYRRFVGMARGSAAEATYHLLLARDLGYISDDAFSELDPKFRQIARMLTGLTNSLR